MTYTPRDTDHERWPLPFISSLDRQGLGGEWAGNTAPTSGTWQATNRAVYLPITLATTYVVRRLWWLNGATVGTNNLQAGIYANTTSNIPGTSILLGTSTLSAGANACQFDNVTDTVLPPGRYWLALWCNGNTATVFRSTSNSANRACPVFIQSTLTGGLPATATPAQTATATYPVFGITNRATP